MLKIFNQGRTMNIKVNGENKNLAENSLSILHLLQRLNVENQDMVSVQVNGQFIERGAFPNHMIKKDDSVEFLYVLGGGAQ
jgi:sulfur carrier protein